MRFLLLPMLLLSVNGYPVEHEEQYLTTTEFCPTDLPEDVRRDINVVSYIQHFKTVMTDYVTEQYNNLTVRETEQVQDVLENFLRTFARDLKETVDRQYNNEGNIGEIEKIEDGIPDETFDEIHQRVRSEFPDINEETAKHIVYKLRRNLFETRQKLDKVIRCSKQNKIVLDSLD